MIYFTSDTHFGHRNIIQYDGRPFTSIEEHDEALINNWNNIVNKNDIVYHLGDFALCSEGRAESIMERLNGDKFYIIGNHDSSKMLKRIQKHFILLGHYHEFKIEEQMVILSHYAFQVWNKSHKGSFHLFGHSHGTLGNIKGRKMDVGMNCNNYFPIPYPSIRKRLLEIEINYPDGHNER